MTISSATMMRLAGDTMIGLYRHSPGFEARQTRTSWMIASGAAHALLNWVGVFEPGTGSELALRDAVSTLRSRGLPAFVYITADAHPSLEPVCLALGLGEAWTTPLLVANLAPFAEPAPIPDLAIAKIQDEESLRDAVTLLGLAFEIPSGAAHHALTTGSFTEPHTSFYGATRNGEMVSTSVITQFGPVIYIDMMATAPGYQRQGIGLALLTHALNAHIARGATVAFLISSQEGRALYDRLGFKLADEGTMYHLEPTFA